MSNVDQDDKRGDWRLIRAKRVNIPLSEEEEEEDEEEEDKDEEDKVEEEEEGEEDAIMITDGVGS